MELKPLAAVTFFSMASNNERYNRKTVAAFHNIKYTRLCQQFNTKNREKKL